MYSKRNRFIKPLLTTSLLIIVGLIGISLAFFIDDFKLPISFAKQQYNDVTNIKFESPSNWTPGSTSKKEIKYKNKEEVPLAIRIAIEEKWISKNGNELGLTLSDGTKATILNINDKDWKYIDGFYYYKEKVNKGETTSNFINSITFNNNVNYEFKCNLLNNKKCSSTGDDYNDAKYTLDIYIETIKYDYYKEIWKINL